MKKKYKAVLLACFAVFAGLLHSCTMDKDREKVIIEQNSIKEQDLKEQDLKEQDSNEQDSGEEASKESEFPYICVFITGCVKNPGVYELPEGTRLYKAIELAGGFTDEAAQDYLNLAAYVKDGDKITVYSEEEAEKGSVGGMEKSDLTDSGYININTADKKTLMTLPGIGESKADAIILYREENGRFSSIEDIMNISGIKQGAFDKIKDLITI